MGIEAEKDSADTGERSRAIRNPANDFGWRLRVTESCCRSGQKSELPSRQARVANARADSMNFRLNRQPRSDRGARPMSQFNKGTTAEAPETPPV